MCAAISAQPGLVLCLTRKKLIVAEEACRRGHDKTDSRPGIATLSTSYPLTLAEVTAQVPAGTRAGGLCSVPLAAEPAAAAGADLRA